MLKALADKPQTLYAIEKSSPLEFTVNLGICARVFFLLLFLSSTANAKEKESTTLSVLKFSAGVISAYALHETGHALAAGITGTEIEWGLGTYNQPLGFTEQADNDAAGALVHASGLLTQTITSEIILQSDSVDKNDAFVRGIMAWNIINPILYALDYWWIRSTNKQEGSYYQGDLQGFEHYTDEQTANLFAATIAVLTAYQGYRFVKTQTWAPDWMKNKAVQLHWRPRSDMGVELRFQIDF